jgi:hypothetical protein
VGSTQGTFTRLTPRYVVVDISVSFDASVAGFNEGGARLHGMIAREHVVEGISRVPKSTAIHCFAESGAPIGKSSSDSSSKVAPFVVGQRTDEIPNGPGGRHHRVKGIPVTFSLSHSGGLMPLSDGLSSALVHVKPDAAAVNRMDQGLAQRAGRRARRADLQVPMRVRNAGTSGRPARGTSNCTRGIGPGSLDLKPSTIKGWSDGCATRSGGAPEDRSQSA